MERQDSSHLQGDIVGVDWAKVPRRWKPEQGLGPREEEMLLSWLGLPDGDRESYRHLAERFGLSKAGAAKIVKAAAIKLAIMHLQNKNPQP